MRLNSTFSQMLQCSLVDDIIQTLMDQAAMTGLNGIAWTAFSPRRIRAGFRPTIPRAMKGTRTRMHKAYAKRDLVRDVVLPDDKADIVNSTTWSRCPRQIRTDEILGVKSFQPSSKCTWQISMLYGFWTTDGVLELDFLLEMNTEM